MNGLVPSADASVGSSQRKQIGTRLVALIAAVMLISSSAFLLVFLPLYRYQLLQERAVSSARLAAILQLTLENAMLKRDVPGLRDIVRELGGVQDVSLTMILEPKGEIRFSSDPSLVGAVVRPDRLCASCRGIDEIQANTAVSGFIENERGAKVLRTVRAVPNRPPCAICHGDPMLHPINGFLVIDQAASDVTRRLWAVSVLLALAGFTVIVAALASIWLALRAIVVRPLTELSKAIENSSSNPQNPSTVKVSGETHDELFTLARNWNELVARLNGTMRRLQEHEAFLQAVIDATPDAVRVVADDYSVVAANAEFCRQAALPLDAVLAAPCYVSSHGRNEPCVSTLVVCPIAETAKRKETIKASHVHVNASTGEQFAVELVAAQIANAGGSDKRLIVESIRSLLPQAQISHEQRLSELGHLAAGVAHEIHNPLASIRLGLNAVERNLTQLGALSDETREFMSAVDSEVDRCIAVTERLMRLSRIPEDRPNLVDVGSLARDAASLLHFEAETRRVAFQLTASGDVRILASEADVGMILINLMQNAMHAMPEGGDLKLTIERTETDHVRVVVADSGVGIAPEHMKMIFQPFWSWRADGTSGSGLGLAICKASATRWGGSINVRSVVGAGSTFEVTFPHADLTMTRT